VFDGSKSAYGLVYAKLLPFFLLKPWHSTPTPLNDPLPSLPGAP